MTSILKPLSTALFGSLLLSGCVLDEDNDGYSVDVQVSDAEKGVAEVTVTVTGDFIEGQSINVTPHMQMVGGMEHGTPFSVNEGELDANGQFKTTAYFLMPSNMPASMGGEKMGDWSINVEYNDVTENFPITVAMMGTDLKKLLGGDGDKISSGMAMSDNAMDSMSSMVHRTYYLFDLGRDTEGANDEFSVYISTRESSFDYSAVYSGVVLNQGESNEYTIAPATVRMCREINSTCTWINATSDGNGTYTATGLELTGMSSDIIRVELSDQNETKTLDITNDNDTPDNTDDDITTTYDYAAFTFPAMTM